MQQIERTAPALARVRLRERRCTDARSQGSRTDAGGRGCFGPAAGRPWSVVALVPSASRPHRAGGRRWGPGRGGCRPAGVRPGDRLADLPPVRAGWAGRAAVGPAAVGIVDALGGRAVRRILDAVDLQPHRTRYWRTPRLDERFRERAEKVLWCY